MRQTLTFDDYLNYAQERNKDSTDVDEVEENRRSVISALDNLAINPDWPHYHETTRITFELPVITGTVSIGHRQVAVTGVGVDWTAAPDAIDHTYVIKFDNEETEYDLDPDIAIGATSFSLLYDYVAPDGNNKTNVPYKLIKRQYLLPDNFRELISIHATSSRFVDPNPMTLAGMRRLTQVSDVAHEPVGYAVVSENNSARKYMRFYPYVESNPIPSYDLVYQRFPRPYAADTDVVDWPDEYRSLMERAIEVEVARKNGDIALEQMANNALLTAQGKYISGANEDLQASRIIPFGVRTGTQVRNFRANVDASQVT